MNPDLTLSQTVQIILHGYVWIGVGLLFMGPVRKELDTWIKRKKGGDHG